MAHLVSLVVHGIFERLPDLRVILLEGGVAWLPGILWRLDTNWRGLRAETPWLERRPSEVVRQHIRFTTQPLEHTDGDDELLWRMLEAAGAPEHPPLLLRLPALGLRRAGPRARAGSRPSGASR